MCLGCNGRCCSLNVDLTSYDLFRILTLKGKAAGNFIRLAVATDKDTYAFRCNRGRVKIVLNKKRGRCIFFNTQKPLKCSIEDAKPSICLSYPFSFSGNGLLIRQDALCPATNRDMAVDDSKIDDRSLNEYYSESSSYAEIVEDWNVMTTGAEDAAAFITFAAREMQLERSFWGAIYRKIKRRLLKSRKS